MVFGGLLFASVVSAHLQLSALHGAQKNPVENFGDYWTVGPNWYVRYIVQADRVSVDSAA